MFESIRKHSKLAMLLLFLLIVPSFILVGIDSKYFSESSPVVARVDGHDITQAQWDSAHRQESDRIRAQQPSISGALLDAPEARYATLERMVRDRVLEVAVQKMHVVTSDAQLARSLQDIPQIAALKRPDGTLDVAAYRALVGSQGLTPEGFEANMRRDLAVNQIMGGIGNTAISSTVQSQAALGALFQRREIQLLQFAPSQFVGKVEVTDEQLEAYYKAHPALFQQAEQANVEYVVLDLDSVRSSITLNEEDLRTYYKENLTRLAGKEERRASHILFSASKDATAADREKSKARAQEVLEQLRKNPASFAELAKRFSQDTSSAPQGGDLNFFARGAMVKPFEEVAFSLKKGDISDVVETDFGYHIIQITDIKAPRQPSFEQLRASLETELRQQQAQRKFAEVAETFANSVYEQANSLQPVAEKLKLKVQIANQVVRKPLLGSTGVLANAKFLDALFSPDSLENKRNTEAVEVGPSQMVAGRVTQYTPTRVQEFKEVRNRVRQLFTEEKAAELAQADGQAKLASWLARPDAVPGFQGAITVSRDQTQNQPSALVDAVLSAKIDTLPTLVGVNLGKGGYAIARINRVLPLEGRDAAQLVQRNRQYVQWLASAEGAAYYEMLKNRWKVEIKAARTVTDTTKTEK